MAKYQSVNGAWPEGTNDGRALKPTPQEAMSAARRLYRKAFGRPFKGTMHLTSGNRYTYIRRGVFYVNPNQRGGGWHEIVHSVSHYACARLHPNAPGHGAQHAFIERELIQHVVDSGWLEGKLRRLEKITPPADTADKRAERHQRIVARIAEWERKKKRAETALRKLARQRAYYKRAMAAPVAHGDR